LPRRPKRKREHCAPFSATGPSHIQVPMQPLAPMQPQGTWQWMPAGACMSAPPAPIQYLERWPSYYVCPDMNAGGGASQDSHGRASRRLNRGVHEEGKAERRKGVKKPNRILVTSCGEIDAGCGGKNAWDSSVRAYVPRILDLSIID
jgi:hypothetical protein